MPGSTSQPPAEPPADAPDAPDAPDPPPTLPRTLHGSCHCTHITYTVTLPLPIRPHLPLASRCNCRVCLKTGFTNFHIPEGRDAFVLLTPESLQSEGVVECSKVTGVEARVVNRWFCGRCGVTICAGGSYVVPEGKEGAEGQGVDGGEGQGQRAGEGVGKEKGEIKSAREELRREEVVGKAEYADQSTAVVQKMEQMSVQDKEGPLETALDQTGEEFLPLTQEPRATDQSDNDGNQDVSSKVSAPATEQRENVSPDTEIKKGQVVNFFSVNIVTLDQPQEGLDLSVFNIEYWDGRNDNWQAGKKEIPWSGGIV